MSDIPENHRVYMQKRHVVSSTDRQSSSLGKGPWTKLAPYAVLLMPLAFELFRDWRAKTRALMTESQTKVQLLFFEGPAANPEAPWRFL